VVKLAYVDSSILVKHYVENEKSSSNASQLIHLINNLPLQQKKKGLK